jgi:2-succinyl-6-hydroxy-2,4-cyclohexadiene-1-carboxylate synthase
VKTEVFALHGFLGEPADWKSTFQFLSAEKPDWNVHAIDVFHQFGENLQLEAWAKEFDQWVRNQTPASETKRILLGYSMGGRLALHALEQDPELWFGAVLLSTHPGLFSAKEKVNRVQSDQEWSHRFANEEPLNVLKDWNAQGVFQGAITNHRDDDRDYHRDYDKQDAVHALTHWSLGKQKDFRSLLDLWHARQMWVAGGKDKKFSDLLKTLPESSSIQKWVVEDASHRLLFEAPQEVAHFIARLGSPIIDGSFGISSSRS